MGEADSSVAALDEAIVEFATALELERGRSRRTVEAYEQDLRQCAAFLAARGRTTWTAVTGNDAAAWAQDV